LSSNGTAKRAHSTILVIPSEVEESLAVLAGGSEGIPGVRDVSTPLDMTKHGYDAAHSSFFAIGVIAFL
jgi:hypothetical protein